MALRTTLPLRASKHISSYGTVLDRFLLASSSSTPSTSTTPATSLFEPTKSPTSGCWAPPKYSLRRQAKLIKEAALTNQLSILPPGPKTSRFTSRLSKLATSLRAEEVSSQYAYVPQTADSSAKGVRPQSLGERSLKPSQRIPKEEVEKALMVAREQVRSVGPYAGRARIFKGSRVDKDKNRRREEVRGKLEAMENTKREWQAGQAEAKNKLKPGLPF